jgi:TPR repeat protein
VKQRISTLLAGCVLALGLFGAAIAGPVEDVLTAFQRGDYAAALQILRPLAEQGDPVAQAGLGAMYERGQGVPHDDAQAFAWFHKAADQGNVGGQDALGVMYRDGRGIAQDYAQAAAWFRKAADQGQADAQMNLGVMYARGLGVPRDFVLAYMWSNLAATRETNAEERERAVKNRDLIAASLTADQLAEAQRLAREWNPTKQ